MNLVNGPRTTRSSYLKTARSHFDISRGNIWRVYGHWLGTMDSTARDVSIDQWRSSRYLRETSQIGIKDIHRCLGRICGEDVRIRMTDAHGCFGIMFKLKLWTHPKTAMGTSMGIHLHLSNPIVFRLNFMRGIYSMSLRQERVANRHTCFRPGAQSKQTKFAIVQRIKQRVKVPLQWPLSFG